MPTVLGYWKIRGLAQPIRFIFAYAGQEVEEVVYNIGWDDEKQEMDKSEWRDVKDKMGFPFPNVPYLIDGDIQITESNAILSYLGRKFDMMGKTEQARVYNDMLLQLVYEAHWKLAFMAYDDNYEEAKDKYLASMSDLLKPFADFLGDKHWFTGDDITVSDFHMYEYLDSNKIFEPSCFKEFPNLQKFCERFEQLPAIQAYMKTEKFIRAPLLGTKSKFGNV